MSVVQTIGTRQGTFTIDSTDIEAPSGTFPGDGNIEILKENKPTRSSGTDSALENIVSSKKVPENAADRKHRLTSFNSQLSGQKQPYTNTDAASADTAASDRNPSVRETSEGTPATNKDSSNSDAAAALSSSVRKRLKDIHRRKVDIRLLNQTAVNTDQVKDTSGHDELYRDEQIMSHAVGGKAIIGSLNTTSVEASRIRKTVSFNTHPETFFDRSVQFVDSRRTRQNLTKPTATNSYNLDAETNSTAPAQATDRRSVKAKPVDESQTFLTKTAEPQVHQSFTPLHPVQIRHREKNQSVSDRLSPSTDAQISGISNTLIGHSVRNKLTKRINETYIQKNETVIRDTDISDHNVLVHTEHTKNTQVNRSMKVIVSKKGTKDETIYNISASNRSPHGYNLGSTVNTHFERNNPETILTPVLESTSSLLENNEPRANNRKEHNKQRKDNPDKHSAENIPTPGIQKTEIVLNSKMARSGKIDYANETFEDVLTERNGMAKTERVYRMRIRQLEEELKQMVHQCQGLSTENKELRKALDGMKAVKGKPENSDLQAKVTKLESDKAKLVAEYNKKLQQMESVMLDSAKIRTVNTELENKVKELEQQLESLHSKLQSHDNERTRGLEAKIRDLQATLKDSECEKKAVEAKVKSLEYDNSSLTDSVENKRREIEELTNSLQTKITSEANLNVLQDENKKLKQDITEMNKKLRDLGVIKQKLQELLQEQESTLTKAKSDNEEKDKIIAQLRKDSEVKTQEIKKLIESQQASRDKEKESLVSRIASLKAEIDSSLSENYKLKQDREDMARINDKLRQENHDLLEASKDSKKYLRKWEQEKDHRVKVEQDLDKKKEEVSMLETRLKEAEKTVSTLKNRVQSEDEIDDLNTSVTNNPVTDKQVLMDQNMKLRQMLVERNIELTNTKHEQTLTNSRIQHLERKQNNAEVQVKQLSEYLGSVIYNSGPESNSETTKMILMSPGQKSQKSPPQKNSSKLSPRKVIEPSVKESSKIGGNERVHTTSSLPLLDTSSAPGSRSGNGYFTLYREKQKRVKGKGYM